MAHDPQPNLGHNAPYKKKKKKSRKMFDKIKRFQAIRPPNHAKNLHVAISVNKPKDLILCLAGDIIIIT